MTASPTPRRYVVGRAGDIPEGGRLVVEAEGREIGIFHVDGAFYALLNRCPHLGGKLCHGQLVHEIFAPVPGDVRGSDERTFITCPFHNWEFDIKTGQSYWNRMLRARPFPVEVAHGDAVLAEIDAGAATRVPGPYMAETIPVTLEDDYLVLNLQPAKRRATS